MYVCSAEKFPNSLCLCVFLSMTGVGGRPEVIIEGSNDLDGPWLVWLDYCPTLLSLK